MVQPSTPLPVTKILQFHGYLLRGTGSNVYNAQLSRALARSGVEVELFSQDRRANLLGFPDSVHLHRPEIGSLLPVYVADVYEGFEARTFLECTDEEIARYVEANVTAVRAVAERERPAVGLANHLVMGPVILARALGPLGIPYAVKVHGSALEYVVKRDPDRFLPWAREGLAAARTVLVGSRHTGESLWSALDDPSLPGRTRLGPPGVDVARFAPRPPAEAAAGLRGLAGRLAAAEPEDAAPGSAFERDLAAAGRALAALDPPRDRLVAYVGKLIVSKGVDLLAAAWPLVLARVPDAKLVVVGFGAYRDGFERLLAALAAGDLDGARGLAREGRGAEGGPTGPLRFLSAFLETVDDAYLRAARRLPSQVVVVGRLEHDELVDVLPTCEAQVVSSTFPEAFGMVAAEAAAVGVLPVSAGHSGLAEVSGQLARTVPAEAAPWLSFPLDGDPVRGLADRVVAWLRAPEAVRSATRDALVATARERFSWEGVARGVLAAAEGRHEELALP
jgi:glycosyltransferase involved in cell wall biosynthesis